MRKFQSLMGPKFRGPGAGVLSMRDAVRGKLYSGASWRVAALLVVPLLLLAASCLPKQSTTERKGSRAVTLYAFSVMKEVMDKEIIPGFAAKWKQEHGEDVKFTASYAGSETITNQILQGVAAHIGIFSIERDVERLAQKGLITTNWKATPYAGVVNKTPFVIL